MENKQTGFAFFVAMVVLLSLAAVFVGVLSYGQRQKDLPAVESQTGGEAGADLSSEAANPAADSSALPIAGQE